MLQRLHWQKILSAQGVMLRHIISVIQSVSVPLEDVVLPDNLHGLRVNYLHCFVNNPLIIW